MGRRWNRKRKIQEAKAKRKKPDNRRVWPEISQRNARMEAFYALQGLHNHYLDGDDTFRECSSDNDRKEEYERWLTSLQSILPASFRIGTDVDPFHRQQMEAELEEFVGTEFDILIDPLEGKRRGNPDVKMVTKHIAPAKRIPFIPHAYQLALDRRTLRRNAALNKFHTWLTSHTSSGFITRQETVSMIPPVVLDIQPHHVVLDMCAAPGSKTSQILEVVSKVSPNEGEPRGCVVANDSDPKRAYMLVHQLRRINSPAVLVTSCDARFFPLLTKPTCNHEEGMFDRVLCDVPCSGDGTTRKNPGIWRSWSALGSMALHPLQLAIALNGARLTKVGGYMCYSTCAQNPMENEAVVAELLRTGSLELVDVRHRMPGLVARPGWSSWRVISEIKSKRQEKNERKKAKCQEAAVEKGEPKKDNDEANNETDDNNEKPTAPDDLGPPQSWDEAALSERAHAVGLVEYKTCDDIPEHFRKMVRKTCFPPTKEEASKFGMEKCLRCLPHDMDTGGFFVALLKKVAPMSAQANQEAMELAREFRPDAVDGDGNSAAPETKYSKTNGLDDQDDVAKASESNVEDESDRVDGTDADDVERDTDVRVDETTDADNTDMAVDESEAEAKPSGKIVKGKPLLRGRGKTRGDEGNDNFAALDDSIWEPLVEYYGFSDTFPREQYMGRACGEDKKLYFVGAQVKKLMDLGIQDRLTMISTGLKSFARNTKECSVKYRIAQEGIHFLVPHMTKRKILASADDFGNCIQTGNIRLDSFSDEFAEEARKLNQGSFVVALKGYEHDVFQKLFLVMWRCRSDAVTCLVAKAEMEGMKSKLKATRENEAKEPANVSMR